MTTNAVVLVPLFVYTVHGLLGLTSVSTIVVLYLSMTKERRLRSNPSSIASVMSLVAESETLLMGFKARDRSTAEQMEETLKDKKFKFVHEGPRSR